MSSYCAPCLADLALVRDAVTSVNGTAACVAHAVLLTHPGDTPQRRLQRLTELRSMAEAKLATASAEDVPAIELLVQEYALAGAMDMTVPLRDIAGDRGPRPPKKRRDRDRGRDRERGPREFPVDTRAAGASEAPGELSGSEGALASPGPDSSGSAPAPDAAPVPDTSQEPASREAHVSPEPSPQGDALLPHERPASATESSGPESAGASPQPDSSSEGAAGDGGASGADTE